jgi:hypothetical protein
VEVLERGLASCLIDEAARSRLTITLLDRAVLDDLARSITSAPFAMGQRAGPMPNAGQRLAGPCLLRPLLDRLEREIAFRIAGPLRAEILRRAGEGASGGRV